MNIIPTKKRIHFGKRFEDRELAVFRNTCSLHDGYIDSNHLSVNNCEWLVDSQEVYMLFGITIRHSICALLAIAHGYDEGQITHLVDREGTRRERCAKEKILGCRWKKENG